MMSIVVQLREEYAGKMNKANEDIRKHLDRGGSPLCDYVQGRKCLSTYYRGSLNALIELDRRL